MNAIHDSKRSQSRRSRLDQLDLNLLRVLDVVHRERSLSRAAAILAVSQSAVSHAVARLRDHLGDPLFQRQGRGVAPTPLADRLAPTVRDSLAEIERALVMRRSFDPRRDIDQITVAMPDELEPIVLPALLSHVEREVPGALVASVRLERARLKGDLRAGRIDVALDLAQPADADLLHTRVLRDVLCVVASRRWRKLDLARYLDARHVAVSSRREGLAMEDVALRQRGLHRRLVVRCRRYETAGQIVAATDLLLTMPMRYAALRRPALAIRVFPFPVRVPPIEVHLYWHRQTDEHAANRWIRSAVKRVFEE